MLLILKEIIKNKKFLSKKYIFLNCKNQMSPEEIFSQLSLLPLFCPIFACVDPVPYSEYGSGSTKLLNTDPIRIHNAGSEPSNYGKLYFSHVTH